LQRCPVAAMIVSDQIVNGTNMTAKMRQALSSAPLIVLAECNCEDEKTHAPGVRVISAAEPSALFDVLREIVSPVAVRSRALQRAA
jgi:hypothetical protein